MIRSPWARARARVVGVAALLMLSGAGAALTAQERGAERPRTTEERVELEQRFRAQMNRMLKERLDISDGELTRLNEVLRPFDQRRRELGREERTIRRETDDFIVQGGADQSAARAYLAQLTELRVRESALFQEEQDALLDVLTPLQVLQLHSFREQMGERIRQLRGRRDDNGRRRRGGGGAPG